MGSLVNRQWLLARRPTGMVGTADFQWQESPVPEPGPGEYLLRTLYLVMAPAQRIHVSDVHPAGGAAKVGAVMWGNGIGEVIQSQHSAYRVGDIVRGLTGWQDYLVAGGPGTPTMQQLPKDLPLLTAYTLTSANAMTAYFGLLEVGQSHPGDTVVISAAAGSVGSLVGQIAKIGGCRVIGLTGSDEKCAWLTGGLGFDAAINYRTEDVAARLRDCCPDGMDIYFDNVGGELLNIALAQLRQRARVVMCGAISGYNAETLPPGPANLLLIIWKNARVEGFTFSEYESRFPDARRVLGEWVMQGRLQVQKTIVEGLENAPAAFIQMFEGANQGQMLVKVADPAG